MSDHEIAFTFWNWYPQEHRITLSEGPARLLGHRLASEGSPHTLLRPLMPPAEYRRTVRLLTRMLRGSSGICLLDVELLTPAGRTVSAELHAQVVQRDTSGRPLKIHGLLESLPERVWFSRPQPGETITWRWHLPRGEVNWEGSGAEFFGSRERLPANFTDWLRQIHSDDVAVVNNAIAAHLGGSSDDIRYTVRMRHGNGEWLWVFCSGGVAERDSTGLPLLVECTLRNVTRNHSQPQEMLRLKSITDQAMRTASMSFWVWELKKKVFTPGPGFMALLDYPPEALFSTRLWKKHLHPGDLAPCLQKIRDGLSGRTGASRIEFRSRGADGRWRWFAGSGSIIEWNSSGEAVLACGIIQDISREKQQERELARNSRKLQLSLDAAELGTWEWDTRNRKMYVNERWCRILGWEETPATIDEQLFFDLLHPDDIAPTMRRFNHHAGGDSRYYRAEFRMKHADGSWVWIFSQGQVANRGSRTHRLWAIGIHQDITERRHYQQNLERLASRDFLTGCGNRLFFDTMFEREQQLLQEEPGRQAALAILDIDHFKVFNDNYGHDCGDLVLKEMSRVLMEEVEGHGVVARIGGEEFGAILVGMDLSEAAAFMDGIRRQIKALDLAPLDATLAEERIKITVGVAAITAHGDQRAIFQAADGALYQGKREGRDQVRMAE